MNNSPETGPEQKMGRGMMYIAWILAIAVLTFGFQFWENRQHNPNAMPEASSAAGVNEVTLRQNAQGHYLANGSINGKPVTFLVDTGATLVSIPEPLARELGLEKGMQGYANTANGRVTVWSTRIDRLQLGSITLRDIRASINPGMDMDEILLGMSALNNVEFTQRDGNLILRQFY